MHLYLMRHGEPVEPMFWDRGDDSRPLSDLGEVKIFNAARAMAAQQFQPEIILSSPYRRALQTAEIIHEALSGARLEIVEELKSGARMAEFRAGLSGHLERNSILVVGHMPDLSIFLSFVTGAAGLMEARFAVGQMVAIDANLPKTEGWGIGTVLWERKLEDWGGSKKT